MKRSALLLLGAFILLALVLSTGATAHAANVPCAANPTSGPVGTAFSITCSGFDPDTYTTAWFTEPDGATLAWPGQRTDSGGRVAYRFFDIYTLLDIPARMAIGTWHFTVSENGNIGIAEFTVTGSTETVAGATLTANPTTITVDQSSLIRGSGFEPGEVVTVWFDFPNDDCSTMTLHVNNLFNVPIPLGRSTAFYGNFKADSGGMIAFPFRDLSVPGYGALCTGLYHVVARGNSSGSGGDTWVTVNGNSLTVNAILTAHPSSVNAMFGTVSFTGSGYDPEEIVNCWLTTPQGATIAVLPGSFLRFIPFNFNLQALRTDSAGNLGFSIFTGSLFPGGPALASEGAVGEWAMTCKGGSSGSIGVARFTIFGNMLDP